jgi:hypothetical protein
MLLIRLFLNYFSQNSSINLGKGCFVPLSNNG